MSLEDRYGPTPAVTGNGPDPFAAIRAILLMEMVVVIGGAWLAGPLIGIVVTPLALAGFTMLYRAAGGK